MIATVLLIAFAVALGAVVMNWGKGFVEATAKNVGDKSNLDLACQQDIELNVKEIANNPKICYNKTTVPAHIEVILENSGSKDVTGMQYAIFDANDNMNISMDTSLSILAGGVSGKLIINHSLSNATIAQVEFTPMIKPKGQAISQLCSKNTLIVDDITLCT